jgi:hypothetical protein
MGFSDFFSSGGTKQESNTGFIGADKNRASAIGIDGLAGLFNSADDLYRNQTIPQFTMSSAIPGLFKEQEGAANAFANNMFAKASAGGALRGQFSMNNTPGIVGSAITNMGSTLLPLISQNLQNAMLIPEQIRTQRFNNVMTPLQAIVAGLGSSSSGTSAGPGLGYVLGDSFMSSFGKGMGQQFSGTTEKQQKGAGLDGLYSGLMGGIG